MEIKEAIKNLEKEMKCRKEDCLGQECHEGGCPYIMMKIFIILIISIFICAPLFIDM